MIFDGDGVPRRAPVRRGMTLIEILAVISIIAVLMALLLPTISGARAAARQTFCANNLKSVGSAVAAYTGQHETFPLSYVYGADEDSGEWRVEDQVKEHPNRRNGYIHWSFALYDGLKGNAGLPEASFRCPTVLNGGAPRTSPGSKHRDWEPGQVNDLDAPSAASIPQDRQSARTAYTGNSAIFPRNKLRAETPRRSRLVRATEVDGSSLGAAKTILATEFFDNGNRWTSLATSESGQIKSHRPVPPFLGIQSGVHVFEEPNDGSEPRFIYPSRNDILMRHELDEHVIVNRRTRLNAVGRHHPGESANFVFVDTHVETTTLRETVRLRLWGDRFYSMSGNNKVDLEANAF